jgi:hypothetical protein
MHQKRNELKENHIDSFPAPHDCVAESKVRLVKRGRAGEFNKLQLLLMGLPRKYKEWEV